MEPDTSGHQAAVPLPPHSTHTPTGHNLDTYIEEAGQDWRYNDYYQGSGERLKEESDDFSYLFAHLETIQEGDSSKKHFSYEGEDAKTRMTHLMHSDTMVVVVGLVVMIIIGLIFRYLCMRLTSQNTRKQRVRGGLRALADHMHTVTRSMSNDLMEGSDSPRAVMRTYSNYGRGRPGAPGNPMVEDIKDVAPVRQQSRENLRVQAFNNALSKEGLAVPGQHCVTIEMTESLNAPQQKR